MKKEYLLIPICFAAVSAAVAAYHVYVTLDIQEQHIFEMLSNQAEISSRNLQDTDAEFEGDLQYAISTIPFHKLLTEETLDFDLLNQMRRFYSKYQNIIVSMQVYNETIHRELLNSRDNYFTISPIRQNASPMTVESKPLQYRRQNILYCFRDIRREGDVVGTIELQLNFSQAINRELKNSYISRQFWPWSVDANGNILTFLKTQAIIDLSKLEMTGLTAIVDDIRENYQGTRKHALSMDGGKRLTVFSAYYPVDIFGEKIGVVLSVAGNAWFDKIKTRMIAITVSFMLIIFSVVSVFVYVLKQRSIAENKLITSESRIKKILMNIQAGVIIVDRENRTIQFANQIAADMARTDIGQMIGKVCHQFVCPAERGACPISDKGLKVVQAEKVLLTADGKQRDILKTVTPLEHEGRASLLETFVDITDLKHQTALANELAEKAKAASRAKSEFLANMSHEIRTPMNSIIGMSHLALETSLTPLQNGYLKKISESAETLMEIITSILEFSKIEAGRTTLEYSAFDLHSLMSQVKDSVFSKASKRKNLEILFHIDPEIPRKLVGDPLKLKQILQNLGGNAVKFTERGRVDIRVETLRYTTNGVVLRFSVRDTGIGISPEQCDSLFQAFSQVDASNTRKYGGTGLGLTISKRFVDMLNGDLRVESTPGEGSLFTFSLEFEVARMDKEQEAFITGKNVPDGVTAVHPDPSEPLRDARVLVVDDDEVNRMVVRGILEKAGVGVTIAENGQEGVAWVRRAEFDAVLMDVQMPVMSGYDAALEIRKSDRSRSLPIIAMTATAMVQDREKALASGMNDHIEKPIDSDDLLRKLHRWIKAGGPVRTAGKPDAASVEKPDLHGTDLPESLPGIDIRTALKRVGGSRRLYRDLLLKFHSGHMDDMDRMKTALASGDRKTAVRIAHTLKGAAGTIGSLELHDSAMALESALGDGKESQALFDRVSAKLMMVMSGIASITGGDTKPEARESVDVSAAFPLLEELELLMKENDLAAAKKLSQIKAVLRNSSVWNELSHMENALAEYDFDAALNELAVLMLRLRGG